MTAQYASLAPGRRSRPGILDSRRGFRCASLGPGPSPIQPYVLGRSPSTSAERTAFRLISHPLSKDSGWHLLLRRSLAALWLDGTPPLWGRRSSQYRTAFRLLSHPLSEDSGWHLLLRRSLAALWLDGAPPLGTAILTIPDGVPAISLRKAILLISDGVRHNGPP